MRDPNRLDNFYDEMKKLHMERMPDIRFGQLMCNFLGWVYQTYKIDPFFLEEDKMMQFFEKYSEENE